MITNKKTYYLRLNLQNIGEIYQKFIKISQDKTVFKIYFFIIIVINKYKMIYLKIIVKVFIIIKIIKNLKLILFKIK